MRTELTTSQQLALSRADAAAVLGIPLGTLASRLDSARKKLAARLIRRGVTLSVGAVLVEARAVAVPEGPLSKTCEVVAVWSAGGVLPQSVVNLVQGGLHVRRTLFLGLVAAVAMTVVGVGLAARPEPHPQSTSSASPAVAVAAAPKAQPEPKKAADAPMKLGAPRLRWTEELRLRTVSGVAWSQDGALLAVAGATAADQQNPQDSGENSLVVLAPDDPRVTPGQLPLLPETELVGFTTDGMAVLAATRETGLINAEHHLHRVRVARVEPKAPPGAARLLDLKGDDKDPGAIPDGGEWLTPTWPQDVRFVVREAGRVTVWSADLAFEARRPLGRFDGAFSDLRLTPDGRRVVALAGKGAVEGYDAGTGKKLWAPDPAVVLPAVRLARPPVTTPDRLPPSTPLAVGLSRDGRRAVIARHPFTPVLSLDLDTGKNLPVPADLGLVTPAGPVVVSGDGRLAALACTPVTPLGGKVEVPGFAGATHVYGPTRLTVWETATGSVVRTWDGRASAVAFYPTRPVLAVLERHRGNTRLGLWDFSAQP